MSILRGQSQAARGLRADTPPAHHFWWLLLGTGVLALWQLGGLPLLDVDEPVYGEVGKEMARASLTGWLSPHYNGGLWFDKPPLFYWLTALSVRLLGVSEFSVRLPSALLGVALVGLTYGLARRMYPQAMRAAFWSGLVLATSVQFVLLSRGAVTDMTLAAALTGALLAVYAWAATGRGRWIVLAGVLTGLATLTKGPVAVVLIGLQVILYLALSRQARRLLTPALWGGFALCLLVALPWYLAMIRLHGALFIQGFLEANNVTRFLTPEHKETQSAFFYVPVFAGMFLPWTIALPGAIADAIRAGRVERREPDSLLPTLFLAVWVVLVFVFFSVSQTKLITYIFPIFPAVAVLVGRWIARRAEEPAVGATPRAMAVLLVALAAALTVAGVRYHIAPVTLSLWLVVLVGGALVTVLQRSGEARWAAPGLATALTLLIAWSSPTWRVRAIEVSERDSARAAARATPPDGAFYALGLKHPSLVFYSARRVLFVDDRADALRDMIDHPGHVYAMRPVVLNEMREKYGLHHYEVLYAGKTTDVIRATPARDATPGGTVRGI